MNKADLTEWLKSKGLLVVLTYSVLLRILVFTFYNGITYFPDSGDYVELADLILNGNLLGYHGARTPGYSLFLALFGNNHLLVIIAQNLLGLLSLYLTFDLSKRVISSKAAVILGLLSTSYLPFIFYDFAILSESLSIHLLMVLIWYLDKTSFFTRINKWYVYAIIGCICSFLFLVRPFFIYLPVILLLMYIFIRYITKKSFWNKSYLVLLIPVLIFLGWNSFNKFNTGVFMTSSYEGINITQVGTSFYEKLPDEYKTEREILLKHRDYIDKNEPNYAYPMTVWYAREELKEATGLDDLELSLRIKEMSKNLLLDNPVDYSKQAVVSFGKFFGAENTLLWNVDKFKNKSIRRGLVGLWIYLQQYALILLNLCFLIKGALFIYKRRHIMKWHTSHFVYIMIVAGALFQAAITYGNNSRFCYPFTVLMLVYSMKWLTTLYKKSA